MTAAAVAQAETSPVPRPAGAAPGTTPAPGNPISDILLGSTDPRGGRREGLFEAMGKSAARSMSSLPGREIIRGLLGTIKK